MSDNVQLILGLVFLAIVYFGTRMIMAWKISRVALAIIQDLRRRGALDPVTAVELPFGKKGMLQFGLRDYRPKALEGLLAQGVVGSTGTGRYYLLRPEAGLDQPAGS